MSEQTNKAGVNNSGLMKKLELVQNRLKVNHAKLDSILEITEAINNNFSKDQLLFKYESILKKQLEVGKLALYYIESEKWVCGLSYGVKLHYLDINAERDLLKYKEITPLNNSLDLEPFDFVIPVYHKSNPLAVVLLGDFDEEARDLSATIKHLPFIQTLTNIILVALENKKFAKESMQQEVVKKELELAAEMQSMLFPSVLPNNDTIEASAFYLPHYQVGGDYYDFIKLNESEYLFCIADVSGKGVSAALLMSNFQANLRVLVNYTSSLSELVNELNSKVLSIAKGDRFITLFIAKYNCVNKVLNYVNAGHLPPVLLNGKTYCLLKSGCVGIGMLDEIPKIHEGYIRISKSATLVCYTDGVTEAENKNAEDFGSQKLIEIIVNHPTIKTYSLNKLISETLIKFKNEEPYHDDVTLLSCKFA